MNFGNFSVRRTASGRGWFWDFTDEAPVLIGIWMETQRLESAHRSERGTMQSAALSGHSWKLRCRRSKRERKAPWTDLGLPELSSGQLAARRALKMMPADSLRARLRTAGGEPEHSRALARRASRQVFGSALLCFADRCPRSSRARRRNRTPLPTRILRLLPFREHRRVHAGPPLGTTFRPEPTRSVMLP